MLRGLSGASGAPVAAPVALRWVPQTIGHPPSLTQTRTRQRACMPAEHGGSTLVCTASEVAVEDCGNPCCKPHVMVTCVQARRTGRGGSGAPGAAAAGPVAQECRAGVGAATMWSPTARGRSVADPLMRLQSATNRIAVRLSLYPI